MERVVSIVISGAMRVFGFLAWPFAAFWSVRTLIPSWNVPFTWTTVVAFWVLYIIMRKGIHTIRYSEWESPVSLTGSDDA